MGFLPKWSLPYRLKLYGNIFVSQMPTLISGIKVEFFAFLSERVNKKKATKPAGFWYVLHKLIILRNFFFLVNF